MASLFGTFVFSYCVLATIAPDYGYILTEIVVWVILRSLGVSDASSAGHIIPTGLPDGKKTPSDRQKQPSAYRFGLLFPHFFYLLKSSIPFPMWWGWYRQVVRHRLHRGCATMLNIFAGYCLVFPVLSFAIAHPPIMA